ncbi:PREDICTED: heterochromatin protein 1-binding protein 3-like [Branchiostoma belcheri]|uniref:Heterochromatin protein 1-binding protein 3-like n=2 Tax=Branchiostoma belcheri TaxID=7741 RepID=A0A6P4YGS9_BRABE|nr:PREDICTED: heterochromatin protein 1-binding protein 3-like [Branchiostoma belcheri]XP_019628475.1 PREDICTED: heterochromatin protein 1-binding protein 3-like [Branchiostoma belcheri]
MPTKKTNSSSVRMDEVLEEAIMTTGGPKGASTIAIKKYIAAHYPHLDIENRTYLLKQAVKRGVSKGQLKQMSGTGFTGFYKLVGGKEKVTLTKRQQDAAKVAARKVVSSHRAVVKKVKKPPPAAAFHRDQDEKPTTIDLVEEAIVMVGGSKGASAQAIKKYLAENYPDTKKHLVKQALVRAQKKDLVKQLSGTGASGTFKWIGPKRKPKEREEAPKSPKKTVAAKKMALPEPPKMEIIIRDAMVEHCEPKEASPQAIKKYLNEHYPHLEIETRSFLLKRALQKGVENGQLLQMSGKGMSGTFRLVESYKPKKPMETMIGVAIKAVNEPKEASVGMIKKYIREHYPTLDIENRMFLLKRALEKGVKNGELEQITGKGASGTYQMTEPFIPSPEDLELIEYVPPMEVLLRSAFHRGSKAKVQKPTEVKVKKARGRPKGRPVKKPKPKAAGRGRGKGKRGRGRPKKAAKKDAKTEDEPKEFVSSEEETAKESEEEPKESASSEEDAQ